MARPSYGMCPNCAKPVDIWGNRWRCGWCGMGGLLSPETTTVTITFSVEPRPLDLQKTWTGMKVALRGMCPDFGEDMRKGLRKVALHEIAQGISRAKRGPELEKRLRALAQFLKDFPELREMANLSKLQADETLFQDVAGLSEEFYGTFWEGLISALPVRAYYDNEGPTADSLSNLFLILGQLYEYCSGTEDDNGGQKHKWELKDAFFAHWEHYIQTHPDGERAKRLLSRGEFPRGEDICREILIADYARQLKECGIEDLEEYYSWKGIIEAVLEQNAALGIAMWRVLLDTAQPCLQENECVAEKLLPNLIERAWLYDGDQAHLTPFLSALEEERFARQVFQSACVDMLQVDLLRACNRLESMALGTHLLDLLKSSPFPRENWRFPLEHYERALQRGLVLRGRRKPARVAGDVERGQLDAGTKYSFCMVQVEGISRPLAYLAGDLPLQVGDDVEVPVGQKNTPRPGRVLQVQEYTRATAPWPPEQTKSVLRKL